MNWFDILQFFNFWAVLSWFNICGFEICLIHICGLSCWTGNLRTDCWKGDCGNDVSTCDCGIVCWRLACGTFCIWFRETGWFCGVLWLLWFDWNSCFICCWFDTLTGWFSTLPVCWITGPTEEFDCPSKLTYITIKIFHLTF